MSEGNRQKELEADGWVRKNVIDEPRLSELVEAYRSIGMEVRLEPVTSDMLEGECDTCIQVDPSRYKVIYVRGGKGEVESELFD